MTGRRPTAASRTAPSNFEAAGSRPGMPDHLAPFAARPVLAAAAAFVVVELLVSGRYGMHRDELYFLACARHLSWGYVDQPPLVPAVGRLVLVLFGPSLFWLRFLSALAGGTAVVLTAMTARRLGGGSRAQSIAAVAAASSAQVLAACHLLSTTAFDLCFWSLLIYLLTRMLTSGDPRWWVGVGAAAGAALENKLNVGYLVVGMLAGLVLGRRGGLLRSGWLAAGAAVAVLIALPDLLWNAGHAWAQLSMLQSLHRENSSLGASIVFIPAQLIVVGPVLVPVWWPGLKRLLRHPAGGPLGVCFLVLVALYALAGAKPYYLAGMYFALFAGGGLYWEERLGAAPAVGRPDRRVVAPFVAMVAGALILAPLTLPVLPEATLPAGSWESAINKDLSATAGWVGFTRQVSGVAAALPAGQRARLAIFTGDYGAAGAIDLYGPAYGLPAAISGHNNYWWWGPAGASDRSTTIAVNLPRSYLLTIFRHVRPAGVVTSPGGVWTEERGAPIWICTGQHVTWAAAWPGARHYG